MYVNGGILMIYGISDRSLLHVFVFALFNERILKTDFFFFQITSHKSSMGSLIKDIWRIFSS